MDNKTKDWVNGATYLFVAIFVAVIGIVVTCACLIAK